MALTFALQKNVAQKVPWTFALYQVSTPPPLLCWKKRRQKTGAKSDYKKKIGGSEVRCLDS